MPNYRSVSQMGCYTTCPKKYKLSYIDKVENMTSSAQILGLSLHKAQEFNYRQKIDSFKDLPLLEIEDFMTEYLMTEFKNNKNNPNFFKVKYGKRETGEDMLALSRKMLFELYHEVMINTQPLFVELGITLNIMGQDFLLYIDLIDDKGIIRDLKTSASKFSEEALDLNTQLIFYALAYRTKFKKKEKGVGLDVVTKAKAPAIQQIRGTVSDKDIVRCLDSLRDINKAIENKIFPPVDNQMTCGWCDFKDKCLDTDDNNLPDAKVLLERLSKVTVGDKHPNDIRNLKN